MKFFILFLLSTLATTVLPAVEKAVVANLLSSNVSIINTVTETSEATLPAGNSPLKVVIAQTKAYVLNGGSNSVTVINPVTDTVITTIPVGANPLDIIVSPDQSKVFVSNETSNSVTVIDVSSDTVLTTIALPGSLAGNLALTPDGSKLYVVHQGANGTVSVIDTTTDTFLTTISFLPATGLFDIAITPDGSKGYVTESNAVGVFSTATDTPITTIATGAASAPSLVSNLSGSKMYLTRNGSIAVIDTATDTVATSIVTVGNPRFAVLSPDGSQVWASNLNAGTVFVVNTATDTLASTINVGSIANWIAFLFDSSKAYVPTNSNNIRIVDTTTFVITNTVVAGTRPFFIAMVETSVNPPSGGSGVQRKDKFLTQIELFNVITWTAPTTGPTPVEYRIYRDAGLTILIGTVPASGPLEFIDHNRQPGVVYTYYIVSVDSNGNQSSPIVVTVNP